MRTGTGKRKFDMAVKVALHNLGCKVNAYELDRIASSLAREGYTIVPFHERADIYVVNTCTVTAIADRKSRQMLHRAKKLNPDALVVALGCFVDTDPSGVEGDACIDIALGNRDKAGLAGVLAARSKLLQKKEEAAKHTAPYRFRTRAYVKIQDGCNLFCSYCIIPYARGRSVSRSEEEITEEIRREAKQGTKEVVLTGIHISSYEPDLAALLLRIDKIPGIRRIRLGSLEPGILTEDFTDALTRIETLCPHFHLSLQSGSDTVLARMRRRYTTAEYEKGVGMLRAAFDRPAITTDIITGFPGETEEEFAESRDFIDRMDFYETHVFPFSARRGTKAAAMEGQLTMAEKKARAETLIAMGREKAARYRSHFLGKPLSVLWEDEERIGKKTYLTGYTERYVRVGYPAEGKGDLPAPGSITTVTPVRQDTMLLCEE